MYTPTYYLVLYIPFKKLVFMRLPSATHRGYINHSSLQYSKARDTAVCIARLN